MEGPAQRPRPFVGRYAIFDPIAAGGMATVHLARLFGEVGFARTVAIKRLHPQFVSEPDFVSMFIDEARLAARVRHPNVVQTLDVGASDGEVFVVMDYIEGEALARMSRQVFARGERMDPRLVARIIVDMLHGLHAAHEATNEAGEPLDIVHRDVSPQNVLVGVDGISRVIDFGIAKAVGQVHTTRQGEIRGKLAYMAPEQVLGRDVTRRTDVFAAGIVLWELLVGKRLFAGANEGETVHKLLTSEVTPPSALAPGVPPALDAVILRALAREPEGRHASAAEMAEAIEGAIPLASPRMVGEWVRAEAAESIAQRAALVANIESTSSPEVPTSEDSHRMARSARATAGPAFPVDTSATAAATSVSTKVTQPTRKSAVLAVTLALVGAALAASFVVWRANPSWLRRAAAAAPTPTTAVTTPPIAASETAAPSEPSASPVTSASATETAKPAPTSSAGRPQARTSPAPARTAATRPASPEPTSQAAPAPSVAPKLYTRD